MTGASILGLTGASEVDQYARYVMREQLFGVALASLVVLVSHEFAHGLTCDAFGGRLTEMGVSLICYVFPGFYCNVSSVHRLSNRSHRNNQTFPCCDAVSDDQLLLSAGSDAGR